MTYGLYLSLWSSVDSTKFQPSYNGIDLDFVIIRARGAGRDDPKFTAHRKWAEKQQVKAGSMIWGADMFLGYAPGTDSGLKQAQDFWQLINAGGKTWEIPPEIDVEHQPKEYNENGTVKSYWPVPDNFLDAWLQPAVKYLQDKLGRPPVIYCSPRIIKEWFSANYTKEPPAWLLQCPLHIAHYGVSRPGVTYWKEWYIWQKTNTTNWPGVSSICIEQFNGSRLELKTWCRDANWKPGMQTVPQPEPQPQPEPEPQPGPVDLSEINAKLDRIIAELEKLRWLGR